MAQIRSRLRAYEAVYEFNRSLEKTIADLKGLEALQVFPRRFLRACRHTAEELRAHANGRLTEVLNAQEIKNSARLSRMMRDRRTTRRSRKP
jgi:hypothetical protein